MPMTMTNLMLSSRRRYQGRLSVSDESKQPEALSRVTQAVTLLYETSGGIVSGIVVFCLANKIVKSQVFHMIGQSVYDDGARLPHLV
jgi:F0F1-type ATP synthase assembly protein I